MESRGILHRMDAQAAEEAPSAATLAKAMRTKAEEAAAAAAALCQDQTGLAVASAQAQLARCRAEEAATKAAKAAELAHRAAFLSSEPFGEGLAQRVAQVLRDGIVVRLLAEDENHAPEQTTYEGVGLSFGGAAMKRTPACSKDVRPEDEVSFSVDSHWVAWEDGHRQHCAPVALDREGRHMGTNALKPRELAPEACRSLPCVLRWPQEWEFVRFLAAQSERSLALLLGPGPEGGITLRKLQAAAGLHDVRRSAFSTTVSLESRRRDEAMRRLGGARGALLALERAVVCSEEQLADGARALERRRFHGHETPRHWAGQLRAQVEALRADVDGIGVAGMGLAGSSAKGLKQDLLRHVGRLAVRADGLLGSTGGPALAATLVAESAPLFTSAPASMPTPVPPGMEDELDYATVAPIQS
uniref:Uncharacterized protein n=1 Tax=Alexandrium monilatum TaxID=311494 RepID=A0A7S4VHS3_9DINO